MLGVIERYYFWHDHENPPQFNLLAIGFPVKIAIGFVGIILIASAIMGRFKEINQPGL